MRIAARHFFVFALSSIFYLLFSLFSPVHAQDFRPTTPISSNLETNVPNTLHTQTQNVMIELMAASICQLAGVDVVHPQQSCLGVNQTTGKIGYVQQSGGALGFMGNMIGMLYTPPLHTADYVRYISQNFGIAKHAYAQGIGFTSLSPLVGLWAVFRNIVYLFFVIAFIVVGIAIMLRIKIDPRTVMTIENQIPKIIISLVLVTFSFAISGFLIDLMYSGMYLGFGIIASGAPPATFNDLNPTAITGKNAMEVGSSIGGKDFGIFVLTDKIAKGSRDIVRGLLGIDATGWSNAFPISISSDSPYININIATSKNFSEFLINAVSLGAGAWAGFESTKISDIGIPFVNTVVKGTVFAVVGSAMYGFTEGLLRDWIPYGIAFLVIFIALLWSLFRLWFALISAYVFILLDVVLAPFWILFGLFPGSPVTFGLWLRDIGANLISFPVAFGMLLLGKTFVDAFKPGANTLFVAPLIGNPGGDGSVIGAIIGFGFIVLTPQVVSMMKEMLKSPQFKYSAAIGQAVGAGTGVITAPVGQVTSTATWLGTQTFLTRFPWFKGAGGAAQHRQP